MNFPLIATSQTDRDHIAILWENLFWGQPVYEAGFFLWTMRHGYSKFSDLLQNRQLLPFKYNYIKVPVCQ